MQNSKDESVRRHNLHREQPTQHSLEGIPTGNGMLGAMTWGGPDELTFTLDRSDLWLTTQQPANELLPIDILRRFCAGTLTVNTGSPGSRFREGLDLLEAIGFRETDAGSTQWFIHATRPLLCIRLQPAGGEVRFRWKPPALWDQRCFNAQIYSHKLARKPGEPVLLDPYAGRLKTETAISDKAAVMHIAFDGKPLAMLMAQVFQGGTPMPLTKHNGHFTAKTTEGDEALLLLTIGSLRIPPAPSVEDFRRILFDCPDWGRLAEEHRQWWRAFWSRSGMRLSHPGMDRLWHMGNYFLGCNARPNSPTITLQGIWSDDGEAPWGNRLGWDLNVQACYSPIYTGNHLDLGFSLYDWYRRYLPQMQEFAKGMFGPEAEGAYLQPGTDDLCQTWVHASCGGLGAGAWVGHFFWQHYLYSGDRAFLRDYCLPVFREQLKMQRFCWRKETDGQYHLTNHFQFRGNQNLKEYAPPQSPEIQMLATPEHPMRDTAYEIALSKFMADAYLQTCRTLNEPADALTSWAADFLEHIVPYPSSANTNDGTCSSMPDPTVQEYFTEWPGLETQLSHRHLSHVMMVHPLGEIHRFSPHDDLYRAHNTLNKLITRGMGSWHSFSFPWASLIATRLGWPKQMPAFMLELLNRCLTMPFNGLITGKGPENYGLCCHSDPYSEVEGTFTIEANLFAVTAVQDALLHGAGEHTVLAGGAPPELDGEFWNLRSPSGDLIAGTIEKGKLVSATVTSEFGGKRRLAVDDQPSQWQCRTAPLKVATEAGHTVIHTDIKPGETVLVRA